LENISIVQNGKRSIKISWNDIDIIEKTKDIKNGLMILRG